jgi:ATP-dependent Clp endopeptidase proteolytic subunit ClpP
MEIVGNTILFHSEITDESVLELVKQIHTMEHMRELVIFIKSDGGDLYSGLSAMDHIRNSPATITTVADGLCASAASIMLLGGHKRLIMENAHVLIHQITSEFSGKYEELKDEKKQLSSLMNRLVKIYKKETSIPENKLTKYLKKDTILSASKCVRYGIVDGIYSSSSKSSS